MSKFVRKNSYDRTLTKFDPLNESKNLKYNLHFGDLEEMQFDDDKIAYREFTIERNLNEKVNEYRTWDLVLGQIVDVYDEMIEVGKLDGNIPDKEDLEQELERGIITPITLTEDIGIPENKIYQNHKVYSYVESS